MGPGSSVTTHRAAPAPPVHRALFVSITNDVGSERAVAAVGERCVECAVLSPVGAYPSLTRFAAQHFSLPPYRGIRRLGLLAARRRLEAAVLEFRPDRIVPLDDLSAKFLCGIALGTTAGQAVRTVLRESLGSPQGFAIACDRRQSMDLAVQIGLRTPGHWAVSDFLAAHSPVADGAYPLVLKLAHSSGGTGVTIAWDPAQLEAALEAAQARNADWRKRVRMAGRRLLWRWAGLPFLPDAPPLLQRHVNGSPAMHMLAASQGRVLDGVSFVAERMHPAPTGPSTVVRHIENPEMADAAARLVEALGCSGIISFDFMLELGGPNAYLIEVNPRPIAAGALGALFGHDVYAAWVAHLRDLPVPPRAVAAETRQVALFPREMERDPHSLRTRLEVGEIIHDIPWNDPKVVDAYARDLLRIHPGHVEVINRLLRPDGGTPG